VGIGQYSETELYLEDLRIDIPGYALLGDHGRNATEGTLNLWWNGRLHAHLDGLERTQSYVGDELGGGTGGQVDRCLPFCGLFLADEVAVEFLEEFVSAVLERSLGLWYVSVMLQIVDDTGLTL
jgi:hypothetical protein